MIKIKNSDKRLWKDMKIDRREYFEFWSHKKDENKKDELMKINLIFKINFQNDQNIWSIFMSCRTFIVAIYIFVR